MRRVIAAILVLSGAGTMVEAQALKVPAGCRAAAGAKASFEGYADKIIHDKTAMEMILVPAGDLTMGGGKLPLGAGTKEYHVTISMPFYMGKTEVTNAHYRRFVQASDAPALWRKLARHGIAVRRFAGDDHHLRIGLPADTAQFDRLAEALNP